MIETYVKWFCNWIDKPYKKRYTLEVWLIKANRLNIVKSLNNENEVLENREQLTIFDYDIA